MKICSVNGCERKHASRGLCAAHFQFWKRNGYVGERQITPLADRFWARVDKTPGLGPNGECWEWRGYIHPTGYGQIGLGKAKSGVRHTHRVSYQLAHGDIPNGMCVLHRCDNRVCVNPDHLWLGTRKENTDDMMAKGRWRPPAKGPWRGEDVTLAKLTEDMVRAMRAEPPMTFKALGEKYGVSAGTAHRVIFRETWAHVT